MPNTTATCPDCEERFKVPTHVLTDDLGAPVDESEIAEIHGCDPERVA